MTGAVADTIDRSATAARPPRATDPGPEPVPGEPAAGVPWWRGLLTRACWVVGALQAVLGVVWWCGNLGMTPGYGDTQEYLRYAQTLSVDQYRTLGYPLLVRGSMYLSTWAGLPVQLPLYLVQTALTVAVAWYLVRSVPSVSRRGAAAATTVIATSPLVVHYAASVLSDSVASSLLVLALAGFGRVVFRGDRRPVTWVLSAVGALGTALMRPEKPQVLGALALVLLIAVAVVRWRGRLTTPGRVRRVAVAVVALLVLPAIVATVVNHATQTADLGRPQGLTPVLMSRIVWPHLTEIRNQLPAAAQARISEADAEAFDAQGTTAFAITDLMRQADGGGNAVIDAAYAASLRCCALDIASATGREAAEFAVTPFTFAAESVGYVAVGTPSATPAIWDLTRMNGAHPKLSDLLIGTSLVLLVLLALAAVSSRLGRRAGATPATRTGNRVLLLVWGGTVVNGFSFAAAGGLDANVRYGVSNAMVVVAALAVWALGQKTVRHSRERISAT